jgi:uncharacterized BrkB/YihY/UPF0761 family membrane protein
MWYRAEHKRSFCKKHALDIGTAVGMLTFFALPLLIWSLGLA